LRYLSPAAGAAVAVVAAAVVHAVAAVQPLQAHRVLRLRQAHLLLRQALLPPAAVAAGVSAASSKEV
jgi:hypothetical protein